MAEKSVITVRGANENNLKNIDLDIERGKITVVTGVSGSGKSSLAFDTLLAEAQRRFFYTLSHYSRQFLDLGTRPKVRQVQGLSPAIGLAQNETQPSRKATVGTLSDASELLAVMFARFGDKACPTHGISTAALSSEQIIERLMREASGQHVAICAPVAKAKKGHFANQLSKFAKKGYSRAIIDGALRELDPIPELEREEKHDICVIIDLVKIKEGSDKRLQESLQTTLELGDGYGEYYLLNKKNEPDLKSLQIFSSTQGCPDCGFSWPKLDSRYFSINSLGRCESCYGYGELDAADEEYEYEVDESMGQLDRADLVCSDCNGTGLNPELRAITIDGKSMPQLVQLPIDELQQFLKNLRNQESRLNPAWIRVLEEVMGNLDRIQAVGLGYLTLSRRVRSLSSGEAQRLRLSGVLGENLRGVLYILDEPSQGLHPSELDSIWLSLEHLKKLGNTLVLVDHDEAIMRRADWVVDLGPGGGAEGGHLMARFAPGQAKSFAKHSRTARFIAREEVDLSWRAPESLKNFVVLKKPRLHNLKMAEAKLPLKAMTVVTGVSGAGKSSLIQSVLYENGKAWVDKQRTKSRAKFSWRYCESVTGLDDILSVQLVDRKPIAKSSVSMPATYLDVFTDLRTFYSQIPDAQIAGLTQASFSLAQGTGRCEECQGRGQISLNMRFLAAAKVICPVCRGARYRPHVLAVKFNGLSLSDVLNLTLAEALEHFKNFPRIKKKLQPACDLGLGYLKMGQLSMNLSGGESQRLKLVELFYKSKNENTLVILDEPTTGLHFEDVQRLMVQLRELVNKGVTVVIIEHNLDVVRGADWLIDLGPGAAHEGGELVYQGKPQGILDSATSKTAFYLH